MINNSMYFKEWENRPLNSNFKPLQDSLCIMVLTITFLVLRYAILDKLVSYIYNMCNIPDSEKESERSKLLGSMVRLLMYLAFAIYGLVTLLTEDWVFSPFASSLTWKDNIIPVKITIYYYLEASFYMSSTVFLFADQKQTDFVQMVIHHIIATMLISLSYHYNILRYGSLIMVTHDISDPFMECAKVFFYLKFQKLADIMFICFACVFSISRCVIYPFFIVMPALTYTYLYGLDTMFVIMDVCMILLIVLNFVWLSYIIQMVINFFRDGSMEGDIRDIKEDKKNK